ncbi:MAG: hypothetical protein ACPLRA_04115 [Candidatus Saccharicenans sp.]
MPEKVALSRLIIKVAGLLSLVTFFLILSLIIFTRFSLGPAGELRELTGVDFLMNRGLGLTIFSLLFALVGLLTASGFEDQKRWCWFSAFFIAIILVLLFPIGTIFGFKLLVNLFNKEVKAWFSFKIDGAGSGKSQPIDDSLSSGPALELKKNKKEEK